ncbi:biotin/lipoyl-binding carrier protein [Aeromicrobium sp. YIM 150415]|uniref:Biotin/lipoyl-binding carrier protein n=1 Tax=Aeromicrobium piscarium TaxID=2590901 RepID=A0A554SB76_9ACTN|nr:MULTISPECIES: biotin/lipoyl-binding carrier protein [Aeromicrobium]MBM9465549.1 biotin/lipoyl-binding carrier protein [Aeromicrobium sp. YIM 150415]TSD63600.1 biotin/lipoyl-binding carrier protein [Aeromicrobium piscarium]
MADVRAEMSASVFRIDVTEGADVVAGDVLVVLESMKMEIPVLAEAAGKVEELLVNEGDIVEEGALLARIL